MKTKILFGWVGIFLIFLPITLAFTTTDIQVKPSFTIGEQITFSYILTSDIEEEISYFASIDCEEAPQAMLDLKTILLQPNTPITEIYKGYTVDNTTQPQNCYATVSIVEPYDLVETKQFKVIANPSFEFDVFTCKDSACHSKSKIFIQEKTIYLDYNSEVENPIITATLIHPDKTTKQLTLPISIKADQIGTYTLEVAASKEGYQLIQVSTDFGVIKNEANIEIEPITCDNNLICGKGETYNNCPKDCPSGSKDGYCDKISDGICDPDCSSQEDKDCKPTGELPWLWIAIVVIIVGSLGLLLFLKK
ncbi:MAG: hypothetical protein DRP06_03650 [Candidatus Aenigmatarchaeota archaeon]|nr:MAG: hypothetical protein DRP06_03650 [Candidatus Aenigmarchaeota archaeon]